LSYKVLARTYRPQRFDALVGQEVVGRTLANAIARNRVHHAYLFCGPRGVGKTSAARILAMALNCEQGPTADPCGACGSCLEIAAGNSLDVQEIDGASHNGVDHVRQLQETAYTRAALRCRIFIIDEVHMLTNQAFNALLKLLEEPPPSVHFIFATTEPHKVIDTIKSRCQRHDFKRIPTRRIVEQLVFVCEQEGLSVEREALRVVAGAAEGGMRDALSLLEQVIAYTGDQVDGASAASCLGLVDRRAVMALLSSLAQRDRATAMSQLDALYSSGSDLRRFADALVAEVRSLVVCAEVENSAPLVDLDAESIEQLRQLSSGLGAPHLRRWLRITLDAAAEISRTGHPRTVLELAILRMADAAGAQALSQLLNHLQGGRQVPSAPAQQGQRARQRPQQSPPSPQASDRLGLRRQQPQGPPQRQSAPPEQRPAPSAPPAAAQPPQAPPAPRPEVMPTAPFLHSVARRSQPLAATLALAGIRLDGKGLTGRLDDARLAIVKQDRSRADIASALAEHGLLGLRIGSLSIAAASSVPQPALSVQPQAAPAQAPPKPEPVAAVAPQPPSPVPASPELAVVENKAPKAAPKRSEPPQSMSSPSREPLPALDQSAKDLLALWATVFPALPDALKGRLVPFAPVAVEDQTLVLGSESEGLIEAIAPALAELSLEHDRIRSLRSVVVAQAQAPRLRSMMRQLRADRDPVFREQLALREHVTTQAVVDLFGAVVDEVGL